jgi:uncharacterized damage-inducible protein DinB
MKMTELFLAELEREAAPTRRVLARVPEGRNDWKPHEKSMALGYLASLVARLPSWIAMTILKDELDLNPTGSKRIQPEVPASNRELLTVFDQSVEEGRKALKGTHDEFLLTPWRLLVTGKVVYEAPRHIVLRDSVFNHLAHHRGQLTVYLRLNDALVPAIYGPSADEAIS